MMITFLVPQFRISRFFLSLSFSLISYIHLEENLNCPILLYSLLSIKIGKIVTIIIINKENIDITPIPNPQSIIKPKMTGDKALAKTLIA